MNSWTSQGLVSVGWQASSGVLPASGPALVSSDTPPRENAARAKYCGKRSSAPASSSSEWAITVCAMGRPSPVANRSKLSLSCSGRSVANGEKKGVATCARRSHWVER